MGLNRTVVARYTDISSTDKCIGDGYQFQGGEYDIFSFDAIIRLCRCQPHVV